jgi:hypothetical protein
VPQKVGLFKPVWKIDLTFPIYLTYWHGFKTNSDREALTPLTCFLNGQVMEQLQIFTFLDTI